VDGIVQGWYRHGYVYDLVPSAGVSRVFSHWLTNGSNAGGAIPFSLRMDTPKEMAAVFVDPFMDMTSRTSIEITNWAPNGRQWLASLELCAEAGGWALSEPFWVGIDTNGGAYLKHDDGATSDGRRYVDVTTSVLDQMAGIGDGDNVLDPGECAQVTNIAIVCDSGVTPPSFSWATWANSPVNTNYNASLADTDGDGMPNGWEDSIELDRHNPFDGAEDADEDKVNNYSEYVADTDPNSEFSYLFLGFFLLDDLGASGPWYVLWAGGTAATQYVEYRPIDSAEWQTLATNTPPTPEWNYIVFTSGTDRVRADRGGLFRIHVTR
jgi:hypothetical protein